MMARWDKAQKAKKGEEDFCQHGWHKVDLSMQNSSFQLAWNLSRREKRRRKTTAGLIAQKKVTAEHDYHLPLINGRAREANTSEARAGPETRT